jgi:hypothetical protein
MPNNIKVSRKNTWLASPTAATGTSPICPNIITSMAFSDDEMPFWMMIGNARVERALR